MMRRYKESVDTKSPVSHEYIWLFIGGVSLFRRKERTKEKEIRERK